MRYFEFIKTLKNLSSTEEVLIYIFNYFKNYVSYNYDELQVVKFNRYYEQPLLNKVVDYINANKENTSTEFKEKIIEMLDDAFRTIESRPLSNENKKRWFKASIRLYHPLFHFFYNGITGSYYFSLG